MLVRPVMKRLFCLKAKNGLITTFPPIVLVLGAYTYAAGSVYE